MVTAMYGQSNNNVLKYTDYRVYNARPHWWISTWIAKGLGMLNPFSSLERPLALLNLNPIRGGGLLQPPSSLAMHS